MYLKAKELPDTYEDFEDDLRCLTHIPPVIRDAVTTMWDLGKRHEKFLYKIFADVSELDSEINWIEYVDITWHYWSITLAIDDSLDKETNLYFYPEEISIEEYSELFEHNNGEYLSSRDLLPDIYISEPNKDVLLGIQIDEIVLALHALAKYIYKNIAYHLPDEYAYIDVCIRQYYNKAKDDFESLALIFYKDGVRIKTETAYTNIISYETIIEKTKNNVTFLTDLIDHV